MPLLAFLFALVLSFVSAEYKPADRYGDACPALLNATAALNGASHTFIFRCRHGDDCGGVGDRLAGAMGAAFFALLSGRSFRILWPGIEDVFKPGHSKWTFDAPALNIPYKDAHGNELDKTRLHRPRGDGLKVYSDVPNVAMFNDLNGRIINERTRTGQLMRYQHVYFHSNRSPDLKMYSMVVEKLASSGTGVRPALANSNQGHKDAYRCMFNDIFQPTEDFLNSIYKAIDHQPMHFIDLVNMVNRVDERSLAFHFRIDDKHVALDSEISSIDNTTMHWLASLGTKHQVGHNKLNLFFITNSPASAQKVMHDSGIRAAFGRVFSQELTGSRHINSEGVTNAKTALVLDQKHAANAVHASSALTKSFQQAMRDWWLMRIADILVCGYSGFCISAGVVASEKQVKYDGILKQIATPKEELCTNRDCD